MMRIYAIYSVKSKKKVKETTPSALTAPLAPFNFREPAAPPLRDPSFLDTDALRVFSVSAGA
jgi:hypothetical protein